MNAQSSRWVLLLATCLVAAGATRAQQALVPGDERRVELAAGAELRLDLPTPRETAFTLVGLSAANDAQLRLLTDDGRELAAASDGWFVDHARVPVPADASQ